MGRADNGNWRDRSQKPPQQQRPKRPQVKTCKYCKEKGHFIKDCPKLVKPVEPVKEPEPEPKPLPGQMFWPSLGGEPQKNVDIGAWGKGIETIKNADTEDNEPDEIPTEPLKWTVLT